MWIAGIVVTLSESRVLAERAVAALEQQSALEVGDVGRSKLPAVLEVRDFSEARYWHEWIESLDGVCQVQVAFLSCEDEHSPDTSPWNDLRTDARTGIVGNG